MAVLNAEGARSFANQFLGGCDSAGDMIRGYRSHDERSSTGHFAHFADRGLQLLTGSTYRRAKLFESDWFA
jgi:hypothetical protein